MAETAQRPAVLFYGDDFTGASDALATAAQGGWRSLMFLRVPDDALLARAGPLDCIGIAGAARAMAPDEMRAALAPVAALAQRLRPQVLHYKVCSTFDSAPAVGNVAVAVDCLRGAVPSPGVVIVGGQPSLRRYCLFGQLFASTADGDVARIDRHPTMSRHPVTPMGEADLRRHLAQLGLPGLALLPWTQLEADGAPAAWPTGDVLVDAARPEHLQRIGAWLMRGPAGQGVLAVGASSVMEAALAASPRPTGAPPQAAAARGPVFVLAGSQSPNTARQVAAAESYDVVRIDAVRLADPAQSGYHAALADDCDQRLRAGRHVLACTMPADDGATPASAVPVDAHALAHAGGRLLVDVLARVPLARVGVAGGDTSSHAVLALDAWGLSFIRRVAPGVPLCRVHSDRPALDGLQIMLKGGQMGADDLFERLLLD